MKIISLITLLAIFFSAQIMADNNPEKLMTFFTTSTERSVLDEMRKAGRFDRDKGIEGSSVAAVRDPDTVEVKGIVIRENFAPVVWVNNGNTLKSDNIDPQVSVKTRSIDKQQLRVPVVVSQKKVILKPGQQWQEADNKISDKFQTR